MKAAAGSGQVWKATTYATHGRFVADLAQELVMLRQQAFG